MKTPRAAVVLAIAALILSLPGTATRVGAGGPRPSTLSVWHAESWRPFWRSDKAPGRWAAAHPTIERALRWKRLSKGVDWATLRLSCGGASCRTRLVVARLDPAQVELSLAMELTREDMRPAWSIDGAPATAVLAVNAGQFVSTMPWGWVVVDGRPLLRPGYGPLSSAVSIGVDGAVRWFHGDSLLSASGVAAGFQSYPTLLAGEGAVPLAIREPGRGVNLSHRDTRLALGALRDGRLLIALTRYDAVGEMAGGFPVGPTTPEMAAIMGALGATDAVMLDGGISAQLLLRETPSGKSYRWPGLRKVPLALIGKPRGARADLPAAK
ncbi:MAG TPA: phosphodiester glycosidase family protein [Candidatus Eisenbacteria bacterium]|nr:phosphodiester glycosidase family protein [Candidatus Eisenbacteria bacterium]